MENLKSADNDLENSSLVLNTHSSKKNNEQSDQKDLLEKEDQKVESNVEKVLEKEDQKVESNLISIKTKKSMFGRISEDNKINTNQSNKSPKHDDSK